MTEIPDTRAYYDAFYRNGDFSHYPDRVYRAFFHVIRRKFFRGGDRILDIGCGTGRQLHAMQQAGLQGTGIDFSREGLSLSLIRNPDLGHILCDARHMPFRDASFDGAVSFGCSLLNTSSIRQVRCFVEEGLRVLRPGGRLLLITRSDFSGRDAGGWHQLTRSDLRVILKHGGEASRFYRTHLRFFHLMGAFALSAGLSLVMKLPLLRSRGTIVLLFMKRAGGTYKRFMSSSPGSSGRESPR